MQCDSIKWPATDWIKPNRNVKQLESFKLANYALFKRQNLRIAGGSFSLSRERSLRAQKHFLLHQTVQVKKNNATTHNRATNSWYFGSFYENETISSAEKNLKLFEKWLGFEWSGVCVCVWQCLWCVWMLWRHPFRVHFFSRRVAGAVINRKSWIRSRKGMKITYLYAQDSTPCIP